MQTMPRLLAIDALRGLLIVFMALDHANHFIAHKHPQAEMWGGAFPIYSDAMTFLTRLVTHLSAPGFFFLMGVGMFLFANARRKQGWSERAIIQHFWVRGAILIALKLLVVDRAWELAPSGWAGFSLYIGVLFALGGTMIVGSFFLRLKPLYLVAFTAALFIGTELLSPAPSAWGAMRFNLSNLINALVLTPGGIPEIALWTNYPILPWLELVTFGILFGNWLVADERQTLERAWIIGAIFLIAFVAIRYLDGFGNIRPRMGDSWIDFLSVVKYPPSMAFTLMTMGINLILLSAFARIAGQAQSFIRLLAVFGRSPLLFYIIHLFLYAALGYLFTPHGTSIPAMYPYWLLGLAILFPLCWWYGRFKLRQPANSLWRFL
jgi:uncharacterized membrane protein